VRLVVIGSADAYNAAGRGHSCYWLETRAGVWMVDFGATALQGLRRCGLDPGRLEGVVLTHFHGDHIGGLPYLLIDLAFNHDRRHPLSIAGPAGTRCRVEAVCRAAYGEVIDTRLPFVLDFIELPPRGRERLASLNVETWPAEHGSEGHALLLRVEEPGGVALAFTGDTAMVEAIFEAARGAACLVAECTELRAGTPGHCSWEEWRGSLSRVESASVVFTHLSAEVRAKGPRLLDEKLGAAGCPPKAVFADDGAVFAWDPPADAGRPPADQRPK